MLRPRTKFIPKGYLAQSNGCFTYWASPREEPKSVNFGLSTVTEALAKVQEIMGFHPSREIHFCMYHSHELLCDTLNRDLPKTMLLAPYADDRLGIILFLSPTVSLSNGDRLRMLRHLIHEICHLFIWEITGSKKVLGDGNCDMKIATWLDEGLAEYVSLTATGRQKDILKAKAFAEEVKQKPENWQLSDKLMNLNSETRQEAFKIAIARVAAQISKTDIKTFMRELSQKPAPWQKKLSRSCPRKTDPAN